MDESPRVEAECPWCGRVEVAVPGLRCRVESRDQAQGLCEFTCPACSRLVLAPVPAPGVDMLLRLGASQALGAVPFELLEPRLGGPLSWDEILDAHVALERGCCPQEELTRSAE
jgi:hypothetical protein